MRVFKVKGRCIYLIRGSLFIPISRERKAAADTLRDGLEEVEERRAGRGSGNAVVMVTKVKEAEWKGGSLGKKVE